MALTTEAATTNAGLLDVSTQARLYNSEASVRCSNRPFADDIFACVKHFLDHVVLGNELHESLLEQGFLLLEAAQKSKGVGDVADRIIAMCANSTEQVVRKQLRLYHERLSADRAERLSTLAQQFRKAIEQDATEQYIQAVRHDLDREEAIATAQHHTSRRSTADLPVATSNEWGPPEGRTSPPPSKTHRTEALSGLPAQDTTAVERLAKRLANIQKRKFAPTEGETAAALRKRFSVWLQEVIKGLIVEEPVGFFLEAGSHIADYGAALAIDDQAERARRVALLLHQHGVSAPLDAAALAPVRFKLESCATGHCVFKPFDEFDTPLAMKTGNAIPLKRGYPTENVRYVTLYRGASGSGKTIGMQHLQRRKFEQACAQVQCKPVSVYMVKDTLDKYVQNAYHARTEAGEAPFETNNNAFRAWCAELIAGFMKSKAEGQPWGAYVAVDEMSSAPGVFGQRDWLEALRDALFAKGADMVQFALGGLGFDVSNTNIHSKTDSVDLVHTQPWTKKNAKEYLTLRWEQHQRFSAHYGRARPEASSPEAWATAVLQRLPVLVDLATNPRMLCFMVDTLVNYGSGEIERQDATWVKDQLKRIVELYINFNGLRDWQLCRPGAAACALQAVMLQRLEKKSPRGLAELYPHPPGKGTEDRTLKLARYVAFTLGMVTCNVDRAIPAGTHVPKYKLSRGKLPYEMSAGMVVLCVVVLGLPLDAMCNDEHQLERHSALHESLCLAAAHLRFVRPSPKMNERGLPASLVHFERVPVTRRVKVVQWTNTDPKRLHRNGEWVHLADLAALGTTPPPAGYIPHTYDLCVYLMAPRVPYADLVAPYRLVQCKFTYPTTTDHTISVQTELQKCGLVGPVQSTGVATSASASATSDAAASGNQRDGGTDKRNADGLAALYAALVQRWRLWGVEGPAMEPWTVAHRCMYPTSQLDVRVVATLPPGDLAMATLGDGPAFVTPKENTWLILPVLAYCQGVVADVGPAVAWLGVEGFVKAVGALCGWAPEHLCWSHDKSGTPILPEADLQAAIASTWAKGCEEPESGLCDVLSQLVRGPTAGLEYIPPEGTDAPVAVGRTVSTRRKEASPMFRVTKLEGGTAVVEPHEGGNIFRVPAAALRVVRAGDARGGDVNDDEENDEEENDEEENDDKGLLRRRQTATSPLPSTGRSWPAPYVEFLFATNCASAVAFSFQDHTPKLRFGGGPTDHVLGVCKSEESTWSEGRLANVSGPKMQLQRWVVSNNTSEVAARVAAQLRSRQPRAY